MDKDKRYRSYTTYSEENGKLVPSIEPYEKDARFNMNDKLILVDRISGHVYATEGKEKLKTETLPNIVKTKPLTNVSTK
jgi:hypothetical protein